MADGRVMAGRILMAHAVVNHEPEQEGPATAMELTLPEFCKRLDALSRAPGKALADVANGLDGTHLTFDDGFAMPPALIGEIERREQPATVFVTTGFVDRSVVPQERELWTLLKIIFPENYTERAGLLRDIKRMAPAHRRAWLDSFRIENDLESARVECPPFMDWQAVAHLARHPLFSIGAHTVNHPLLTRLTPNKIFWEIAESRRLIYENTGNVPEAFAYPYGGNSIWVRLLTRLAGFRCALGTKPEDVSATTNRLRLPRYDLNAC